MNHSHPHLLHCQVIIMKYVFLQVNMAMLENILSQEVDAFVLFYDSSDPDSHPILEDLERIDEKLDKQDLTLVKISDPTAPEFYGLTSVPALVYFDNGVPEIYTGRRYYF